jgi:hypothetical protein
MLTADDTTGLATDLKADLTTDRATDRATDTTADIAANNERIFRVFHRTKATSSRHQDNYRETTKRLT